MCKYSSIYTSDAYTQLSDTYKSVFILFNITDHQTAAIVFGTIFITDIIKYNMKNSLSQGLVFFIYTIPL